MNATVCAVVVTFNRLDWLKNCIAALRSQSRRPDAIVVVNNGSTDQTAAWLDGERDLIVVNQGNRGSAGGQNSGIKVAFERGYHWIWCMDDDGKPKSDCLHHLLDLVAKTSLRFVSPLVVDCDNTELLAFRLPQGTQHVTEVRQKLAKDGILDDYVVAFNGTFIHREVIEQIGNVKNEMFIWGDEMEYILRARKAGFKVASSTEAIHYHPACRIPEAKVWWGHGEVLIPAAARFPIYARNLGYISTRYYGFLGTCKQLLKYGYYFLFCSGQPDGLFTFLRYFLDGALDRYALPPVHRVAV